MTKTKDKNIVDFLKKVIDGGLGAAVLTEDVLKGLFSDISIHKDLVNHLLTSAKKSKEDFLLSLKDEVHQYLKDIDWGKELSKILDDYQIEVKVNFKKKKKK